jgi:hypothetical protein
MTLLERDFIESDLPSGQHVMRVIDRTGDTKVIWSDDNPDEVENARRTFNDLRKKGYTAYAVGAKGAKGEVVREFDPSAEKLILAPALVGG